MIALSLAAVSCAVGVSIGMVGIGGILLVPALTMLGNLNIHSSSATALFTFIFTGVLGTYLFARRGSIDWRVSLPVCASALAFSFIGARVNAIMDAAFLSRIIALVILLSGAYIVLPVSRFALSDRKSDSLAKRWALLIAVGTVSGFGSGLSGAGGPLFSVPIMLMLGFAPLTAIGASQVLQIISAAAGTLANLKYGSIDFTVVTWITLFELVGVIIGVRAAHVANVHQLRKAAAWFCLAAGVVMLMRGP